ncbi:MAG: hypothetical protein AAGE96_10800 [Cyanobacteria bacterium P01_G01_bin.19]
MRQEAEAALKGRHQAKLLISFESFNDAHHNQCDRTLIDQLNQGDRGLSIACK